MPYGTAVVVSALYEGLEVAAGLGSPQGQHSLQYRIAPCLERANLWRMVVVELEGDTALCVSGCQWTVETRFFRGLTAAAG